MFDANTVRMVDNLRDAIWPFHPENQTHLTEGKVSSGLKPADKRLELYGPLWILITLVIEFTIINHLAKTLAVAFNARNSEANDDLLKALIS